MKIKIIIVAFAFAMFAHRGIGAVESDGALDLSFAAGKFDAGEVDISILQPDGKLLIAGAFTKVNGVTRQSIARLNPNGTLDYTFDPGVGPDSFIGQGFGGNGGMILQPDGKIIISSGFNGGGFTTIGGTPRAAGIARLNNDGSLDTAFDPGRLLSQDGIDDGTGGAANPGFVNAVVLQPDGKIVVTGQFFYVMTGGGTSVARSGVARFNSDGTFDVSYNPGSGLVNTPDPSQTSGYYAVRQSTGKITIAGQFDQFDGHPVSGLVRLNTDGSYDGTFSPGTATTPGTFALYVQNDDQIVAFGQFTSFSGFATNSVVRLGAATGAIDPSFSTAAFKAYADQAFIINVAQQSDGKLLVAGSFHSFGNATAHGVVRLNTNGSRDVTFDSSGGVGDTGIAANCFAIRPSDNKIFVGGGFPTYNNAGRNTIALINPDGSLDNSFVPSGGTAGGAAGGPFVAALATQSDGKVIVGGFFRLFDGAPQQCLMRLNADGSIDHTFAVQRGANRSIRAMLMQPDGKIMIAGQFNAIDGIPRNRVARLNPDGTVDPSFNPGDGPDQIVYAMAQDSAGNTYIGGDFLNVNGSARAHVAKLKPDGSLDTTFNPGTGFSGSPFNLVRAIAVNNAGVVVGGAFTEYNGSSAGRIARLDATTAAFDSNFNAGGSGISGGAQLVRALSITADGKYLVGGGYNTFNGVGGRRSLIRLNSDGSFDSTFASTTLVGGNRGVATLAILQQGDKILAGGRFAGPTNEVAHLLSDGSSDPNFNVGTGPDVVPANAFVAPDVSIQAMALSPDGRLVIGGTFNQYNGTPRICIARLAISSTVLMDVVSGVASSCYQIQTSLGTSAVNYQIVAGALPPGMTLDTNTGMLCGTPTTPGIYFFAVQADDGQGHTATVGFTKTILAPFAFPTLLQGPAIFDQTFNPPLFATKDYPGRSVVMPDGKYVLFFNVDTLTDQRASALVRFLPDGTLDPSFNFTADYSFVESGAALPDGRLIIAAQKLSYGDIAQSKQTILRVNTDGSIDPTFNSTGTTTGEVRRIVVRPDGKIWVTGFFTDFAGTRQGIVRLLADGTIDPTFNSPTFTSVPQGVNNSVGAGVWTSAVETPDGKILVGGTFSQINGVSCNHLARLNSNGSLDSSFNASGYTMLGNQQVRGIVVQSDGKVVFGGGVIRKNSTGQRAAFIRLNSDGSFDDTFNLYTPFVELRRIRDMIQLPDGKILTGGDPESGFGLNRFNPDGSIDPTFQRPFVTDSSPAFAQGNASQGVFILNVQNDGRLLVSGLFDTVANGASPATTFTRWSVARFNSDGTLDTTLVSSRQTGFKATPNTFIKQSDGTTWFTLDQVGVSGRPGVPHNFGRLQSNGSLDSSFDPFGSADPNGPFPPSFLATAIAPLPNGQAFVFGSVVPGAVSLGGIPVYGRLLADGTIDPSYAAGTADFNNAVAQPDGQVLVSSDSAGYVGFTPVLLAAASDVPQQIVNGQILRRITTTGVFDTTFNLANEVKAAMVQRDGTGQITAVSVGSKALSFLADRRILFTYVAADGTYRLVRLNLDGSLDSTFQQGIVSGVTSTSTQTVTDPQNGDVSVTIPVISPPASLLYSSNIGPLPLSDSKVLASGKVIVTGTFTSYNGTPAHGIIRLNADGTVDSTFNPGAGAQWTQTQETSTFHPGIDKVVEENDGKLLIAGTFEAFNGNAAQGVATLDADGSFNAAFLAPAFRNKFDPHATNFSSLSDSSFLLSGPYSRPGETTSPSLVHLIPPPQTTTSTGTNVTVSTGTVGPASFDFTFPQVTTAGVTTVVPINPSAAGSLPTGYELTGSNLAFDIATTAQYTPPVFIAFHVPSVDDATFAQLRVLHNEGGTLVDRTASNPPPNPTTKTIYASVSSFSPFVVAKRRDTTPPTITTVTANPNSIWPPNKKMVPVKITVNASDASGIASTKIISVTSNESGSGQYQITGDLKVNLLADRNGNGNGRIYTITVQVKDTFGNASTQTTTVTVPHDQGH